MKKNSVIGRYSPPDGYCRLQIKVLTRHLASIVDIRDPVSIYPPICTLWYIEVFIEI